MAEEAPAAPAPVPEKPPAKAPAKASARSRGNKPAKSSSGGGAKRNRAARSARDTPSVAKLIIAALSDCKERKGLSVPALKKYLASNNVDVVTHNKRINRTLTKMLAAGTLVQLKGNGASGSFKLAKKETKPRVGRRTNKDKDKGKGKSTPSKSKARRSTGAAKVAKKAKDGSKKNTKKTKSSAAKSSSQKPTKPAKRASGKTKPEKKSRKPATKKSPARKPPAKKPSKMGAARKSANKKK